MIKFLLFFLCFISFEFKNYAGELEILIKSLQMKLKHIEKNIDNETIVNYYKNDCIKMIYDNYLLIMSFFYNESDSFLKQNEKINFVTNFANLILFDIMNVETKNDFKNKIKEKIKELMKLKINFSNNHEFYKIIITFYIATFIIKNNQDINLNEGILDFINETFKQNTIQTLKINEKYLNRIFEKINFFKIENDLIKKIKINEIELKKKKNVKIKKSKIKDHYDINQLLSDSKKTSEENSEKLIDLDNELNSVINDIKKIELYKLNDYDISNFLKINPHLEALSKIKSFEEEIINDNFIFDYKIELLLYLIKILEKNDKNGYIQVMEKIYNNSENITEEEKLIKEKRKELINCEILKLLSYEIKVILATLSYYKLIYTDKSCLIIKHLENEILKKFTEIKFKSEKNKRIKTLNNIISVSN